MTKILLNGIVLLLLFGACKDNRIAQSKTEEVTKYRDYFPAWSPDGQRIVFVSNRDGDNDLYLLQLSDQSITTLTYNQVKDGRPVWSPDGQWIAYYSEESGNRELFLIRPDGSDKRQLTHAPGKDEALNWSPDSKTIAFYSERDGNGEIYTKAVESGTLTRITDHPARDRWPCFTPDGKAILFNSDRDTAHQNDIYRYSFIDQSIDRLTNNSRDNYNPECSPDGSRIAFTSASSEESLIMLMDSTGTIIKTISANGSQELEPKWSFDGKYVSFVSIIEGNWDIFTIDIETNKRVQLTSD